jgi:hypothetical protein
MTARTFVWALFLSAIVCSAATAQQIPRFDIAATCKNAQPLLTEDRDPVQSCIHDETEAEQQLQGIWNRSAAANRQTCVAETRIAGSPSYVDLLSCLEMFESAGSTAPQGLQAPQRHRRQP